MTNQRVWEEPSSQGKQAYPQTKVLQELLQPNSIGHFCQAFVWVKVILFSRAFN